MNSIIALIQILKARPYLSCMPEALIMALPDIGLKVVPFARSIRRFPASALIHRSLEGYGPVRLLVDRVKAEAKRLRRS